MDKNYKYIGIVPDPAPDRCVVRVGVSFGITTHFGQCQKKSKEIIDGYPFCTIHARKVKEKKVRLGDAKPEGKKIYMVRYEYGELRFGSATVINETPQFYNIMAEKGTMGYGTRVDKGGKHESAKAVIEVAVKMLNSNMRHLRVEIDENERMKAYLDTLADKSDEEVEQAVAKLIDPKR